MSSTSHQRRKWSRAWITFALAFGVMLLWAAATPMFATPDEPAHMIRAAGIVRGQVDGDPVAEGGFSFDVPSSLRANTGCYAFKPEVSADCLSIPDDVGDIPLISTAATYPPAFHVLVGWPTLFLSGLKALYAMRMANALICAAMFAMSVSSVRRLKDPKPALVAILVAATPMVYFLSGPVNPSGMATMSGLAVWTGWFALISENEPRGGAKLSAVFGAPLLLLLLVRRDSLLWGSAILIALVTLTPARVSIDLLRQRSIQLWAVLCVFAAGAQALLWTGGNASAFASGADAAGGGSASRAFGDTFKYFSQAIGVLGWLDTKLPGVVYKAWYGALWALVIVAVAVVPWRTAFSIGQILVMTLVLTTVIGAVRYPYLQGRYLLPLAIGIPLVAGYGLTKVSWRKHLPARVFTIILVVQFVLHQLSFFQHLRRYAVGSRGSWGFMFESDWSPPMAPIWLLLVLYLVALAALYRDVVREPLTVPAVEAEPLA